MGGGAKSWAQTCPYCLKRYVHTNLMRRPGWDYRAGLWNDTHLLACKRKARDDAGRKALEERRR